LGLGEKFRNSIFKPDLGKNGAPRQRLVSASLFISRKQTLRASFFSLASKPLFFFLRAFLAVLRASFRWVGGFVAFEEKVA